MTRHIPNLLTLCNLAAGIVGIVAVFHDQPTFGSLMIWLGAGFDFLDGMAARLLKKTSVIGKDLDSLADLITFCFLPGSIIYQMIEANQPGSIWSYTGFLLVIFGALRLAKFNNDTRQEDNFYGLPVPASAICVSAFSFFPESSPGEFTYFLTQNVALIALAIILSALMVSDIKMLSLKFKNLQFQTNLSRYILLLVSVSLLVFFHISALPVIILFYVALSVVVNNFG